MLFKENNLNNFENNSSVDNIKKKENIMKRIISHPVLQRILLAGLLTISTPSDVMKDGVDNKKDVEPKEILDSHLNSPSDFDSGATDSIINSTSNNERLSSKEYKINTQSSYPSMQKAPVKTRISK